MLLVLTVQALFKFAPSSSKPEEALISTPPALAVKAIAAAFVPSSLTILIVWFSPTSACNLIAFATSSTAVIRT